MLRRLQHVSLPCSDSGQLAERCVNHSFRLSIKFCFRIPAPTSNPKVDSDMELKFTNGRLPFARQDRFDKLSLPARTPARTQVLNTRINNAAKRPRTRPSGSP